jgi:hypothetical protein
MRSLLLLLTFVFFSLQAPGFSQKAKFQTSTNNEGLPEVIVQLSQTQDEGDLKIIVTFDSSKGFLGPSSNPSDQKGFTNAEGTLFGVTYEPVTKSAFVKLFLVTSPENLLFLKDINAKAARLLKPPWSAAAKNFLRIESIKGHSVHLQTVDFSTAQKAHFDFTVAVRSDGTIFQTRSQ